MHDWQDRLDLRQAVLAVEPAARFVPARVLRRAIRLNHDRAAFPPKAVHDSSWWVERDHLFTLLTPLEFGLSETESANQLLLIPQFDEPHPADIGRRVWRILFHAAVDRQFDRGLLNASDANQLRRAVGPVRWHVIRQVLTEENLIDRESSELDIVREFIAFGSEVKKFEPELWGVFFPGIAADDAGFTEFTARLKIDELLEATRPPLPGLDSRHTIEHAREHEEIPLQAVPNPAVIDSYSTSGNDLRAAILLVRAGQAGALERVDRLIDRLRQLVSMSDAEREQWRKELHTLLPLAAADGWPIERRLLYEIQRACVAIERPVYSADLVEWIISFGRRAIKRPLPKTRLVEAARRFRAALKHAEQLANHNDSALLELVEHAKAEIDRKARDDLRPHLVKVLDEVGLVPTSVVEQISRDKLVDELLDTACAHGFLRIGDLRDVIARNRVKLADLSGPGELIRGDPLIEANRKLAIELDGVYRRGEVYMRGLQRGCSFFFGTKLGRLFTRFVALPFGGAFLFLEAVNHMIEAGEGLVHWLSGWSATLDGVAALGGGATGTLAENPTLDPGGVSWPAVLIVGCVLFLLIHWRAFRTATLHSAKVVLFHWPRLIARSPLVRSLFRNQAIRLFRRYLFFPLVAGGVVAMIAQLIMRDWKSSILLGGGAALFIGSFFRTPLGRGFEDRLDEAVSRLWRIVSVNFVMGLLMLVLQLFQAVFHAIDQTIYAVDERLRFREGQSRSVFVFKVLFGALWFIFTYIFRFAWTLLVEPQINPIKHFPVVTVSHKMLLPLIPSLAKQFRIPEETMGTIVFGIPGIFGFLVWELKENWKLYRANASPTIRPAVVGSHGEKVRALLRPGFHSGVVPKTFAKLRRAARNGDSHRLAKHQHTLHHIAEAVERLADREFVRLLRKSPQWSNSSIHVGLPVITPNRLLIAVHVKQSPVVIALEERGGWIIGSIDDEGPLATWTPEMRDVFECALAGLYKLAGVEAVREQMAEIFGSQARLFDANPEGLLIVGPDGRERLFAYDDGLELTADDQTVAAANVLFSARPIAWCDWVQWWVAYTAGQLPKSSMVPGWRLIPEHSDASQSVAKS